MIKITFPDGTVKEYKEGITSLEIAARKPAKGRCCA